MYSSNQINMQYLYLASAAILVKSMKMGIFCFVSAGIFCSTSLLH